MARFSGSGPLIAYWPTTYSGRVLPEAERRLLGRSCRLRQMRITAASASSGHPASASRDRERDRYGADRECSRRAPLSSIHERRFDETAVKDNLFRQHHRIVQAL